MNDQDRDNLNPQEESASERLRRILSSRGKNEQEITDISSSEIPDSRSEKNAPEPSRDDPDQTEALENTSNSAQNITIKKIFEIWTTESKNILQDGRQAFTDFFVSVFKKDKNVKNSAKNNRRKSRLFKERNFKSCLLYSILGSALIGILAGIIILSFLIVQYFRIAADLPSVDNLAEYASKFETARIYDRNGNLIYEIIDPNAGRRTYVELEEVSPYLIAATIATEDKDFFTNPGFDPWGIIRALWQNYTSGQVVSGASTITQQLARTLLLSPEERVEISTRRKAREIVLAAEITRKYTKNEILELYLNENNYGNLAYGIEAAAETYFNTTADQLDLPQASFLAGIPQAPAVYDIFTNREETLIRQLDVLNLMYQLSIERNCIPTIPSQPIICVSLNEAVTAAQTTENYAFKQRLINMPYPHWVNYIRLELEKQFDPQTIYRSGFKVFTTLDPNLQEFAQTSLQTQVEALTANDATNGAVMAIKPTSGEILAMVGSADFFNEAISGQVNMALAPRQPGSSIKPLTYAAAFEKGWTPSTLIWDVPSEFPPSGNPTDTRDPYKPVNYDGKFHGPVLVRMALASSYNIPAVKALDYVGIYDNPDTQQKDGLISFAERLGITTFDREDYGLSLTLGGGDVSLLELTGAYAIFANEGKSVNPFAIERIEDHFGDVVYQHPPQDSSQIIDDDYAYLISDILSDNNARSPAFGTNSILNLPFPAAVKTGTTNDFRDNWTIGYTPDIAVGVWIGNADYTPMKNISGVSGAGPLWNEVMQWAINTYHDGAASNFKQPESIETHTVCKISGTEPSQRCPSSKTEIFASNQPPDDEEHDIWQEIALDTWTNLKAGPACAEFSEEKLTINVTEKWAVKWLTENSAGKEWLEGQGFIKPYIFTPERECSGNDPRPTIVFVGLENDMNITASPLDIYAVVNATGDFESFRLQYGVGNNPKKWTTLVNTDKQYKQPQKIISWDVYEANANRITLRIIIRSKQKTEAEKSIHLNLLVPTLTPTITPSPTATLAPTLTPSPTNTDIPTIAGTAPPAPSDTPIPAGTP